jgi:transcriptional regulator with XRE-family HTH domain
VPLTSSIGSELHAERIRRRLTLEDVAAHAGISRAAVHSTESGRPSMLETYVRIATSLGRRLEFGLVSEHGSARSAGADSVHAAMGEVEAGHLQRLDFQVRLDELYQH